MLVGNIVRPLQEGVRATVSGGSQDSGSGDDERRGHLEVRVCGGSEGGVQNPGLPGGPRTVPLLRLTAGRHPAAESPAPSHPHLHDNQL